MADAPKKNRNEKDGQQKETIAESPADQQSGMAGKRMGVRLAPVGNSDQPLLVNFTTLNVAPGMAFIDCGFIEPGMLSALPRMAQAGGKLPEQLNGKLVVRVAMGYDALAGLHQQLGQMLSSLNQAARAARDKKDH